VGRCSRIPREDRSLLLIHGLSFDQRRSCGPSSRPWSGPRLVGTDDRCASEGLDCRQAADQGVSFNHPLDTDGREIVTTAGSASGTTATARAIPKIKISRKGWPLRAQATIKRTTIIPARARSGDLIQVPCNGSSLFQRSEHLSDLAEFVSIPVATTTPRPRPYVAIVPGVDHVLPIPNAQIAIGRASLLLLYGTDSPVRAASSI